MLRFEKFTIYSETYKYKTELYENVKHDATVEPRITDNYIEFVISEKSDSYNFLVDVLEKDGTKYHISETRWFFDEEIESAEYVYVNFWDPWAEFGTWAKDFGTRFDEETGCPKCGKRRKIIEPIITDRRKMLRNNRPRYEIGRIYPETYASENFIDLAKPYNFTGISFGKKLIDRKSREMPNFYRVIFDNILPPVSSRSIIYKDMYTYCKECGEAVCYMNSEMIYDVKDKDAFLDFNMTCEIFGELTPRIIVSQKAYQFLKQFRICGRPQLEPIYFQPLGELK